MSVLIKGGRIVTAADDYVADLYVEDETVTLIGESLDQPADKVIDASGTYVLPGCVDPHTHLDMPFGGTTTIDDVESGQTAAAFGRPTTHGDFIIQPNRAIQLARVAGSPLYVVHVSCKEAVEPIALAREKGWDVWGETCTQYFFIDYSHLERPNFEGAKYVYTPPPRAKENQEVLWNAVRTDILQAISTDHCAFRWDTQKSLGKDDFSKIPNGGPGLENRLQMIHQFGVRDGRITLNRMVELLATNPAKLFGLYPRKGTIAVGSDADIVVFDPEKKVTISAKTQHSKTDYNLYEGTEVTGSPEVVLLRGQILVEGDELAADPGIGQFVRRARFGEELKPAATTAA